MSETAIITAASLIGAGLVCLGAATGVLFALVLLPVLVLVTVICAENLSNLWLVSRKKLVKSLPTCWFA